ncbi:MAG: tetratricopeptide repeat protein [Bacteroidota bacterium]
MIRLILIAQLLVMPWIKAFTAPADSLILQLETAMGSEKADLLNEISVKYWYSDPSLAQAYASQALELARELDYPRGVIQAYRNLGVVNDVSGNYDDAISWYTLGIEKARHTGDSASLGALYNNVGLAWANKGVYEKATDYYLQALPLLETKGTPVRLASVLNNLGLVYYELGRHDEALTYHERALETRRQLNSKQGIGASLHNIGMVYASKKEPDTALTYFLQSETVKREINDYYGLATTLNSIGSIHLNQNRYNEAEKYYLEAVKIRERTGDKTGLAIDHYNLGLVAQRIGNYQRSISEMFAALEYARESGALVREYRVYGGLMETYRRLGDFEQALHYYQKYSTLKDSVFSLERTEQISRLKQEFEYEQQQQQIALLNTENELNNLTIERQRVQTRWMIITFSVILLSMIMAGFFIRKRIQYQHQITLQQELHKQQEKGFKAIMEAQENQRMIFARELHDGLGQILSTAKLQLYALESHLIQPLKENLATSLGLLDDAITEVRSISHDMMPAALMRLGLVAALNEMARKINAAGAIKVIVVAEPDKPRLRLEAEIAVYRIVQEIINNAIKHSSATEIVITYINQEGNITLGIEDNGKGLDKKKIQSTKGIGWLNINTRVNMFNGTININSQQGAGTRVEVKLVA